MRLRAWRFVTVMLLALTLGMTFAHALELPAKLGYDPALYTSVNATLYRYFGLIGGPVNLLAVVATVALVGLTRDRGPAHRWTIVAAVLVVAAFASWWIAVFPVNTEAARTAPDAWPAMWERLRQRWEFGHATGFVLYLLGFAALIVSILTDTPREATATPHRASP